MTLLFSSAPSDLKLHGQIGGICKSHKKLAQTGVTNPYSLWSDNANVEQKNQKNWAEFLPPNRNLE